MQVQGIAVLRGKIRTPEICLHLGYGQIPSPFSVAVRGHVVMEWLHCMVMSLGQDFEDLWKEYESPWVKLGELLAQLLDSGTPQFICEG